MVTPNVMKKLSMTAAGVAFIALGSAFAKTPSAEAAILSVDNSGSWITGANTISNLGFNMVTVPNDLSVPGGNTPVTTLSSPLGNLTFSPEVQKVYIGSGWATWSNGYTGEVYSNAGATTTTITLPFGIGAFDLYVEPNTFNLFEIAVRAVNGTTTTLSQLVDGLGGAQYFGFYSTDGDSISSITVSDRSGGNAGGFAMAQMRLAAKSVPEPASTLGLLAFCAIAAGSVPMRRKHTKKA